MPAFTVVVTVAVYNQEDETPILKEEAAVHAERAVLERMPIGLMAQEAFNEILREVETSPSP